MDELKVVVARGKFIRFAAIRGPGEGEPVHFCTTDGDRGSFPQCYSTGGSGGVLSAVRLHSHLATPKISLRLMSTNSEEKEMKFLIAIGILIAIAVLFFGKKPKNKITKRTEEKPRRKRVLTEREQSMYNRLAQALPDMVVLAQVSFGALMTARSWQTRNSFDRKIADFVICDKAFQVIAVIELDDASHRGKEEKDAERDAMLKEVGYRVVRYPNIPDAAKVKEDFAQIMR